MTLSTGRLPRGFHWLISAQFSSALADNALLIVTIALLVEQGQPGWWAPLLKFGFTLSYVLLAPFVGPLADAFPKARLMAWMNAVKALGVLALLAGVPPVAAFVVVGFGAAAYAPCKYGLITELVEPERLVAANGWLEVSVVCAALLGTVLGGALVSPWLLQAEGVHWAADAIGGWPGMSPSALLVSLALLLVLYGVAGLCNLGVPESGARYAASLLHPAALLREFRRDHLALWRDRDGGLSLAVTTLFWGLGATLQFAVLRWAADALKLPLDQPTCRRRWRWVWLLAPRWPGGMCRCGGPSACCRRVCCWGCWCRWSPSSTCWWWRCRCWCWSAWWAGCWWCR